MKPSHEQDRRHRLDPGTVLVTLGAVCVVLGGLVAAVTEPLDVPHGSWLAAYLVLVAGVTQYATGRARSSLTTRVQPDRLIWAQVGSWNLGNVIVITGTLVEQPLVIYIGSTLLVGALAIAVQAASDSSLRGWTYRVLLGVLAVSIPVGMLLSHLRHS